MPTSKISPDASIYQLKVSLKGIRPPIWRRIQVQSDTRLFELHRILQVVMGWEDYHLHQFSAHGVSIGTPDPDLGFEMKNEKSVTLRQVLLSVKAKLSYEYDFGESWEHEIVLEKIVPPQAGGDYPFCLTGKRACPPEDCGGIWGYEEFQKAIKDPDHPEHDEMLEWVGGEFDPEAFDPDAINRALQQMKSASRRRIERG